MDKRGELLGFGVIYLVNSKGFYQLLMNTIVMISRLKALITESQTIVVFTFSPSASLRTRYCVQVKLCYVKRLFIRWGIRPTTRTIQLWAH